MKKFLSNIALHPATYTCVISIGFDILFSLNLIQGIGVYMIVAGIYMLYLMGRGNK